MIKKMKRSINILVLGIIVIALLSFVVVWQGEGWGVIWGKITGEAISEGGLEGLELSVVVPEKYQRVQAGERLQFQVSIKDITRSGRHDVQLDYYIKKNEIIIASRRELKAVETQASFLSSITVPEETLPGIYDIEVQINEEESAIATFYVKSSDINQIKTYLIILIMAILLVGAIIAWQLHKLTKKR